MATGTAAMTGFRGIGGINQHEGDASILRFIGDELPQLVECPTVVAIALDSADLGALPDPVKSSRALWLG